MKKLVTQLAVFVCIAFSVLAFAGSCEVSSGEARVSSAETVWIRLVAHLPVVDNETLTAELDIDFSKPIDGLNADMNVEALNRIITFESDSYPPGAPLLQATQVVKYAEAFYRITVINVPANGGHARVFVNSPGVTPPSRAWSLDGQTISDAALLDFRFERNENPSFPLVEAVGSIDQQTGKVVVIVPPDTILNPLKATVSVSAGSGYTPESQTDFTSDVLYTVISAQNKDYVVSVIKQTSDSARILSFGFTKEENAGLSATVSGDIDEDAKTISVTVPDGTNISALKPHITHSGLSISPANLGIQDFGSPVTYTVTAINGATRSEYMVTVIVDSSVTVTPTPNRTDESIKTTFGITSTGTTGVSDTFNAVHNYLTLCSAAELASDRLIQLGDYIDLEGGISVSGGAPNPTVSYGADLDSGHGNLLRLIVVGINSFNASGDYTGNGNGTDAHLVFQFQNLPFTHRMEATNTNANGYAGSEMKTFLTDAFLTGIYAAGVPDSVLWAPTRFVANKGIGASAADTIRDKLWLPTERELFGARTFSVAAYETEANQARLEYYTSNALRSKYNATNSDSWYWQASPITGASTNFCNVIYNSYPSYGNASSVGGCAPAFCVK